MDIPVDTLLQAEITSGTFKELGGKDYYSLRFTVTEEGAYKGANLEALRSLEDDKFKKTMEAIGAFGVTVNNMDTHTPTGRCEIVTDVDAKGYSKVKFFNPPGGKNAKPASNELKARVAARCAALKAGKAPTTSRGESPYGGGDADDGPGF